MGGSGYGKGYSDSLSPYSTYSGKSAKGSGKSPKGGKGGKKGKNGERASYIRYKGEGASPRSGPKLSAKSGSEGKGYKSTTSPALSAKSIQIPGSAVNVSAKNSGNGDTTTTASSTKPNNSGRGSSNQSTKVQRPVGLDESKWYYYDRDDKLFGPFPTE